jgi:hypothetical protein
MKTVLFRFISGNRNLVLKASDGSRLIYEATDTFKAGIDPGFVKQGINKPGIATPEILVQVREIFSDGNFMDIFQSLQGTWEQKWLSQNQVIDFCETFPNWLGQEGFGTFALIKKDENKPVNENKPEDNLAVVYVCVDSNGQRVDIDILEDVKVWDGEYRHRHRVMSPQPK